MSKKEDLEVNKNMKLNDLSIRVRLIAAFIIVAIITATVGMIGITNIRTIDNADSLLYEQCTVPIILLSEMSTQLQLLRVSIADSIIAESKIESKQFGESAINIYADLNKTLAKYEKIKMSKDMRDDYNRFDASQKRFLPVISKVIDLSSSGQNKQAAIYLKNQNPLAEELHALLA